MRRQHRKTAPRVRHGKVQRKDRCAPTPTCYNTTFDYPMIERWRPGCGFRHLLRREHIERFIGLLPDWPDLSQGLNAIVLARGEPYCDGWHRPGVVALCAWDRELAREVGRAWFDEHRVVFDMIGLSWLEIDQGDVLCQWTESTARAYQLTHVLLHELGHHHDRMTTRRQRRSCRGETYAEHYALRHASVIWRRYLAAFGNP